MSRKYLTAADLAHLFDLDSHAVTELVHQRGFPSEEPGGWPVDDVLYWAATQQGSLARTAPLEYQRPAREPATYKGVTRSGDHLAHFTWETSAGDLHVVYGIGQWFNAAHQRFYDDASFDDSFAVVRVTTFVNLHIDERLPALEVDYPGVPQDMDLEVRLSTTSWPVLAAVLGQPIPYFPPLMRSVELFERWHPGTAAVVDLPLVPDQDVDILFVVAGLEEDQNSPVARTLRDLAVVRQGGAITSTLRDLKEIEDAAADYCIHVAAQPAVLTRRGYHDRDTSETERRAAWMELFHRDDDPAARCIRAADVLEGTEHFPYNCIHHFDEDVIEDRARTGRDSVISEWLDSLTPVRKVAGHIDLLDTRGTWDDVRYLEDPATGAPAVDMRRPFLRPRRRVSTLIPAQIPNTKPLAEVILDDIPWVRTNDGKLYLMPVFHGTQGLAWGYSGRGSGTLAATIEALLDDITARGTFDEQGTGVTTLLEQKHPHGTILDRDTLLAAYRRPHTYNW
jgi:hypothetical protein